MKPNEFLDESSARCPKCKCNTVTTADDKCKLCGTSKLDEEGGRWVYDNNGNAREISAREAAAQAAARIASMQKIKNQGNNPFDDDDEYGNHQKHSKDEHGNVFHEDENLEEVKSGEIANHPWVCRRARTPKGDGEVIRVCREHTFSQMVPFVTMVWIKLDSGETVEVRQNQVKIAKKTGVEEAKKGDLRKSVKDWAADSKDYAAKKDDTSKKEVKEVKHFRTAYGWAGGRNERTGGTYKQKQPGEKKEHTVYCSQCGGEFKRSNKNGFSHCNDHKGLTNLDEDTSSSCIATAPSGKTGPSGPAGSLFGGPQKRVQEAGTPSNTYGVKDKKGYNVYTGTKEGAQNYVKKNPGKGLSMTNIKKAGSKKVTEAAGAWRDDSPKRFAQEILEFVRDEFGGQAWFKGGSYAYKVDSSKPNQLVASDGSVIECKNIAQALAEYCDSGVFNDFADCDQSYWSEFFRPVKNKTPMARDGAPMYGNEQERNELANMRGESKSNVLKGIMLAEYSTAAQRAEAEKSYQEFISKGGQPKPAPNKKYKEPSPGTGCAGTRVAGRGEAARGGGSGKPGLKSRTGKAAYNPIARPKIVGEGKLRIPYEVAQAISDAAQEMGDPTAEYTETRKILAAKFNVSPRKVWQFCGCDDLEDIYGLNEGQLNEYKPKIIPKTLAGGKLNPNHPGNTAAIANEKEAKYKRQERAKQERMARTARANERKRREAQKEKARTKGRKAKAALGPDKPTNPLEKKAQDAMWQVWNAIAPDMMSAIRGGRDGEYDEDEDMLEDPFWVAEVCCDANHMQTFAHLSPEEEREILDNLDRKTLARLASNFGI